MSAKNDLVEHLLDLWHVLKSINKGIRERVDHLKDDVCTQKVHVVAKCLNDTLWKSLSREGEGLAFHQWLRVGSLLGSLEETGEATPAKLVRTVDEYVFGNDVNLAAKVQKYQIEYEKERVGCGCTGPCTCGRLKVHVDYVAKAKSKSSGCRPPLDRKKISQLKPYKAASSISESQFLHTHAFLRKRRHFMATHSGRCLLTSEMSNCRKIKEWLPFFDKGGSLLPVASLKKLYDRVITLGISKEDIQEFSMLRGLHRRITKHMRIDNPD